MSTVVLVTVDGKEKIYFRIVEHEGNIFIERPESASISARELHNSDSLSDKVIAALEAIQREDDKWHREKNREVTFPSIDRNF